jgi:hypothetical protein
LRLWIQPEEKDGSRRRSSLLNDVEGAVIVRLDRTIQYAAASRFVAGVSGILDPRMRGDDD